MANYEELDLDIMEQVTGGVLKTINTGMDSNAAIKNKPGNGRVISSLPNGWTVDTIGNPVFDKATDRNWVEVQFRDPKGKSKRGWVAASIVGLPRK